MNIRHVLRPLRATTSSRAASCPWTFLLLGCSLVCSLGCTVWGPVDAISPPPIAGAFSILSYNVAGLPDGLSSGDPVTNIPLISPGLNAFDLVLVQEDFSYQRELRADVEHPHQSLPKEPQLVLGDGLNRFSKFAFDDDLPRERWETCNGTIGGSNDCLAEKGFSIATHEIALGVFVDVVNLHMDAGGGEDDRDARAAQVEQLITYLDDNPSPRPLIVAGDTNLRPSRESADDATVLQRLFDGAQLRDGCAEVACGEEDRIDRVMMRDGEDIEILPRDWRVADEFVDADGDALSDHEAITLNVIFRGKTR